MSSITYRKRVVQGLCGDCGCPSVTSRCDSCNERLRSYKPPRTEGQLSAARAASKRWYEANADRVRAYNLAVKYRITPEQYDALLAEQGGGCAICGDPEGESSRGRRLFVDHDHATGRVRGLLCLRCNHAIGYLQDDPERARKVAEYLS